MRLDIVIRSTPSHTCPVYVGSGVLEKTASLLATLGPQPTSIMLIHDAATAHLARDIEAGIRRVPGLCTKAGLRFIRLARGERAKSLAQIERMYRICLRQASPPDRHAIVVAVGGGALLDAAGFFAATWRRGIRLVNVPTTLLAQVDASIGGKTAIDIAHIKNPVGVFHQPSMVIADPAALTTLAQREFVAALAEVVKYGVVLDAGLFRLLERNAAGLLARDQEVLATVIARCIRNKGRVVARDERERGLRMVLNYGHTLGHAVETLATGRILHGEAVAMGMTMACSIGVAHGLVNQAVLDRQSALLVRLGLPLLPPQRMTPARIARAATHDKKRRGILTPLVLPSRLGHHQVYESNDVVADLRQGYHLYG